MKRMRLLSLRLTPSERSLPEALLSVMRESMFRKSHAS